MKGKKIKYNGIVFRSKIEAKWAWFFDIINLEWKYEPKTFKFKDGTYYKPDFWLPQVKLWAEVKPDSALTSIEENKLINLIKVSNGCILLDNSPCKKTYNIFRMENEKIEIMDCVISMYHNYPISEHRFYENTDGCLDLEDFKLNGMFQDVGIAVETIGNYKLLKEKFKGVK